MAIMDSSPTFGQSYPPPPPPPASSRKRLWIGLAIGAVILCLCCAVLVGVYTYRQQIPYVSSFFSSPTPTGLTYSNPSAGISFTYPFTWQYTESGEATSGYNIILASSKDILDNLSNAPTTGAAMVILTKLLPTSDFSFTVDATKMVDVVTYVASTYFTNVSGGQNVHAYTVSGLPAGSGIYSMDTGSGTLSAAYLVTVLRNNEIMLFLGICPQAEWAQHQPTFDSIVNSAVITTP
jgi:hypothetical protein